MMRKMNHYWLLLVFLCFFQSIPFAQISAPEAEAVYGGRITGMAACEMSASETRLFITTESANSAFYADIVHGSTPTINSFKPLSVLDASAGMGPNINMIGAVPATGTFVFKYNNGLAYTNSPFTSMTDVTNAHVRDIVTADNYLFYIDADKLYWGTFDGSGNYTQATDAPITIPNTMGRLSLQINHYNGKLYYCDLDNAVIYHTSDDYNALTASTTITTTSISPGIAAAAQWQAFGFAPDGRCFLGGHNGSGKYIAYTNDFSTWTDFNTMGGVSAQNFSFAGDSSAYHVYFASTYSDNNGLSGSWNSFGNNGSETHPNDGPVFADPVDDKMVFMTTDQGIGVSEDGGATTYEINDGVEAVQVKDLDMTGDKNTGWIASKSGIRRVVDYTTTPVWTNAMFPTGDGSPYYSAEMDMTDNNTVFVGNLRVYKTTDNGANWSRVFSPEDPPYNFSNVGPRVEAIEIYNDDPNIVMAGYYVQNGKGGLFVTEDGGSNWEQIHIKATADGQDVNVNDVEFTTEGGNPVAYVGVEYEMGNGYSVYRVEQSGGSWTVSQDMSSANTSTGSVIVVTIADVEVSATGDTIFATGTDAGTNHPVAYYKPVTATGKWTPFTTSGFPFEEGKKGAAITIGRDTLYCAVDNEIYYYPVGGSSWTLGYSYPLGTEINFLFFDDLLAGTGTGLYEHESQGGVTTSLAEKPALLRPENFKVYPNPFTDLIQIEFELTASAEVWFEIYDMRGQRLGIYAQGRLPAGSQLIDLSLRDFPEGAYLLRLQDGKKSREGMLLKIK